MNMINLTPGLRAGALDISKLDLPAMDADLLDENGIIKLFNAEYFFKYPWEEFRAWLHFRAAYGIPTRELIRYLKLELKVINEFTIEIGSGNGWLAHHLRVTGTDSKLQDRPDIAKLYDALKQPRIKYPDFIEKIDALEAVKKYKPHTVIGQWITQRCDGHELAAGAIGNPDGVRETEILKLVKRYIVIGSDHSHKDKKILKIPHKEIKTNGLVSRERYGFDNTIFVWENI